MAKIGNETKLLLKLAKAKMDTSRLDWMRKSTNQKSSSYDPSWLSGYDHAFQEWVSALTDIIIELEGK